MLNHKNITELILLQVLQCIINSSRMFYELFAKESFGNNCNLLPLIPNGKTSIILTIKLIKC